MKDSIFPKEMHHRILFAVTAILLFMFDTSHALVRMYHPPQKEKIFCSEGFVPAGYKVDIDGDGMLADVCIEETVKDSIVTINTDSIGSLPNFGHNYEIPYIGKNLMIGGVEYSASKVIRKTDETRLRLMRALQIKRTSGSKIQFDLRGIKKAVQSLKKQGNLFSEINLRFKHHTYKNDSTTINLLNSPKEYHTTDFEYLIEIEFVFNTDLQKAHFETSVLKTKINSSFLVNLKLVKKENKYQLESKFNSWKITAPGISAENTRSLPYVPYVVDGSQLEVSITPSGVKTNITDFSVAMETDVIDTLKKIGIPFFGKLQFSKAGKPLDIKEIFEMVNIYNIYMQLALDDGIVLDKGGNEGKLHLTKIKNAFAHFPKKKFPPGRIAILNESLKYFLDKYDENNFYDIRSTSDFSKIKKAKLHNQSNTLIYKVTLDSLQLVPNNRGIMQSAGDINVSLDAHVKLNFHIFEGFIIMEDCFISRVDLSISANIRELDVEPYTVHMGDGITKNYGKLRYSISIDMPLKSAKIYNPSTVIDFDDISLRIRNLSSVPLHGENYINRFVYDFKHNKWELPEILKTHKLTPDELLKKTYAIVNALRGLREQVKNSPEEFPAGSAEKIANFTEKFEQIVYGDGTEKCNYSLLKTHVKKGQKRLERQKNFTNLSDGSRTSGQCNFLDKYRHGWKNVFDIDRYIDYPCDAIYLDSKKSEINPWKQPQERITYVKLIFYLETNIDPIFKNALNEQLSKFSEDGQVLVNEDGYMTIEFLIDLTH